MSPITLISSRFEASPQSSRQWKCLLHEIKLLYIQRQFKQCATRASEILETAPEPIHPVYSTYLYFYSAISYEAMGRAAHSYSNKKLSLLHSALDCFVTCSAVLPSPVASTSIEEDDRGSSQYSFSDSLFSDRPSSAGSLVSITDVANKTIDSPDVDPFVSDTVTAVDSIFNAKLLAAHPQPNPNKPRLISPPLKVHTSTSGQTALHPLNLATGDPDDSASSKTASSTTERPVRARPPPLPIKIVPFGTSNARGRRREVSKPSPRPAQTPSTSTPQRRVLRARKNPETPRMPDSSVYRYNSSLQSLRVEINASIAAIHALIDETAELQEARRATRNFRRSASFWSFSPVKDGGMRARETAAVSARGSAAHETKEQRIARLRTDGWNTVGLKAVQRGWKGAEYYQAYCTAVLNELSLER